MERASWTFVRCLLRKFKSRNRFAVIAGNGNNGGDGMAIARILLTLGFKDTVCYLLDADNYSEDNRINQQRLRAIRTGALQPCSMIPASEKGDDVVWIDALFGTGISRKPEGEAARWINFLNTRESVVSVDLPSGMYGDQETDHDVWVKRSYTITFQLPKAGLLIPAQAVDFEVCDIGLDANFIAGCDSRLHWITEKEISAEIRPRARHSHKGTYGHLLLVAGSAEKPGAACLATMAALRSGCGLTTTLCPEAVMPVLMQHAPEAMVMRGGKEICDLIAEDFAFTPACIAAGPGLGTSPATGVILERLLERFPETPIVLDADALNLIAQGKLNLNLARKRALLTPHPGEFQRLAGSWRTESERLEKLRSFAAQYDVGVILKGTWSVYCHPDGNLHYLSRGTDGLARGGSGDVLTGILGGLIAAGYQTENGHAAKTGMLIHAIAGEIAAAKTGTHGMTAADLIPCVADAWRELVPLD
jgi:ADP-dependent NAD(P)H-hydrate dehydratase / NAD(P)H-hydrate epimerase